MAEHAIATGDAYLAALTTVERTAVQVYGVFSASILIYLCFHTHHKSSILALTGHIIHSKWSSGCRRRSDEVQFRNSPPGRHFQMRLQHHISHYEWVEGRSCKHIEVGVRKAQVVLQPWSHISRLSALPALRHYPLYHRPLVFHCCAAGHPLEANKACPHPCSLAHSHRLHAINPNVSKTPDKAAARKVRFECCSDVLHALHVKKCGCKWRSRNICINHEADMSVAEPASPSWHGLISLGQFQP